MNPSPIELSRDDRDWIKNVRKSAEREHASLIAQRNYVLQHARLRLKADYLVYSVGLTHPLTLVPVFLECYDDSDDAMVFFEARDHAKDDPGESPPALAKRAQLIRRSQIQSRTWYVRYARTVHRMNASRLGNLFLSDIAKLSDKPLITVEREFLVKTTSFRKKIALLTGMPHLLAYRAIFARLNDFMFSIRRQSDNIASGIGYHRRFGAPPFTARERQLADYLSFEHDDLLHRMRVHVTPRQLEILTSMDYKLRLILPLLLSPRFRSDADIGLILKISENAVNKSRRRICEALGLENSKNSLFEAFFWGNNQPAPNWQLQEYPLAEGLENLRRADDEWRVDDSDRRNPFEGEEFDTPDEASEDAE